MTTQWNPGVLVYAACTCACTNTHGHTHTHPRT